MTFTSLTFLLFLPLVFGLYWLLRRRELQNLLLIAASYLFYGWWDYRFCALMLGSSLIDFFVGAALHRCQRSGPRRALLGVSLISNLGLLGVFKYFNFFSEGLADAAQLVGWRLNPGTLNIILPVGISFYTFQTLSYTIDIYRRQLSPSRSLIDYLAFVSFFPQLVAGPIERASRLLPQFASPRRFDEAEAYDGCRQMLWGFFKKLVIADRLALVVDPAYSDPSTVGGVTLGFTTVCFAFQIYCDFSAYSDIAIGCARLFGIRLMRNFAYPYFSQSIGEFWRRWHISLSTWFRDYVYIPLGGSRAGRVRTKLNLLTTFLVSGLWHGAAWNFVLWGGVNGIATAADGRQSDIDTPGGERLIPSPATALRMLATFLLVCVCWTFFRAESTASAVLILQKTVGDAFSVAAWSAFLEQLSRNEAFEHAALAIVALVVVEWLQRRRPHPLHLPRWPIAARWLVYTAMIWGMLDMMEQGQEFIYFAF